jgi:hypothetical protein
MFREIAFAATAIALTTLAPTKAHSAELTGVGTAEAVCPLMRVLAKNAMEYRQGGYSISDYMNKHIEIIDLSEASTKLKQGLRIMVRVYAVEAYKTPVWPSEEFQEYAVEGFANDKEAECYSTLLGEVA